MSDTPNLMPLPFHISLLNYCMELNFAVLPSDPLSNRWKAQLLRWRGSKIGKKVKFGRGLWIDDYSKLAIGDYVFFNYGCMLLTGGGVRIDDYVLFGPGVTILSANHDIRAGVLMRTSGPIYGPVHIEAEAWLAARSVILPGVTIGKGAVVAAGAVVTKDIEPYSIVGGVPARVIGRRS